MSAHQTDSLAGHQSSSPVLFSPSSLSSGEKLWRQHDRVAVNEVPSKSRSRLPIWAYHPPPARLERNPCHDRFAQLLKIQHTPPAATVPVEHLSNTNHGDDDDDDSDDDDDDYDDDSNAGPPSSDPNHQPVPTKWLMLGYSRVADIPASLPTETMTRGCQRYPWPSSRARNPTVSSEKNMIPSCEAVRQRTDWMQEPHAQVIGVITLFLIAMFLIQGMSYLARRCFRGRSKTVPKGGLALQGDEKQIRALAEATIPRIESFPIDPSPPV
jgi:hypothetical protein